MNPTLKIALSLAVCVVVPTCNFTPPSSPSPPLNDGSGNGNSDDSADSSALDDDAVLQVALTTATAAARAAAVTILAKDIQPIFEAGMPAPACPSLDASLTGRDLDLAFDYGDGCQSSYFQDTSIRGVVRGLYYTAYNAFDLQFENVAVNDQPLSGATTGRIDVVDGVQQTTLNLNVEHHGISVRGSLVIDLESDSLRLNGGDLTVADSAGNSHLVSLLDVGVRAVANPSLSPQEGSAQITPNSGSSTTARTVNFASQTTTSAGRS